MATPTPIQFVLTHLDSTVQMSVSGSFDGESIPPITTDARAIYQVSVDDMKAVFKYQTDSNDVLDASDSDIQYYVYDTLFPTINPANAMMDASDSLNPIATSNTAGSLASNKMLVAHDFVRYLAFKLFGTHYGVDLFNNEVPLLQNLRSICDDAEAGHTWYDIKAALADVGTAGGNAVLVANGDGDKYMTNEDTSAANLCRVLLKQMWGADPSRFASIEATDAPQSLPFYANDSISFVLSIDAAPDQELLTGVAAIPTRSYEIRLLIVDGTAANTEVDAAEL